MSRVRLTARGRSAADQTPYPGNVNQPDRNDPKWEQYHTFEQKVNHELPDMRHDWQNDGHDGIGFGIPEEYGKSPTVAAVRVAANKAVRVAVLLLGDKVSDEAIEAQARDLMAMGPKAMDRTLARFADTQKLYADDEKVDEKDEKKEEVKAADEKKDEKVEDKKDEKTAASEAQFTPAIEKPGAEVKAADEKKEDEKCSCKAADEKKEDEKKDEAKDMKAMIASAVAEAFKAAFPDFIQKKIDEKKDGKKDDAKDEKKDEKKAADEKVEKVEEKKEEVKATDESEKKDEKVDEKTASVTRQGMNEFDIELTGSMDDEVAPDAEADERLASLFDDPGMVAATAGNSDRKVEASQRKTGITKLGGQPRVASAEGGGVDISSIWQSAPDVSEAFK